MVTFIIIGYIIYFLIVYISEKIFDGQYEDGSNFLTAKRRNGYHILVWGIGLIPFLNFIIGVIYIIFVIKKSIQDPPDKLRKWLDKETSIIKGKRDD